MTIDPCQPAAPARALAAPLRAIGRVMGGLVLLLCLALASPARADTPLHLAARTGDLAKVAELLSEGADPHRLNHGGHSALGVAAGAGQVEVAALLLAAGARPDVHGPTSAPPLRLAVPHPAIVAMLLEAGADAADPIVLADAMIQAALHGHEDSVAPLLAAGAPVDRVRPWSGSALSLAAEGGYLGIVEQLLAAGADPELTDREGRTALYHALRRSHGAVAERLLDAGADIHGKGPGLPTPLHGAAAGGLEALAERLITAGAAVDARDASGRTPLHRAAERGKVSLVAPLIAAGARIEAVDNGGERPLHLAARNGWLFGIEALLDAGADIEARNRAGETPLLIATERDTGAAAMLIAAGASTASRTGSLVALGALWLAGIGLAVVLRRRLAAGQAGLPGGAVALLQNMLLLAVLAVFYVGLTHLPQRADFWQSKIDWELRVHMERFYNGPDVHQTYPGGHFLAPENALHESRTACELARRETALPPPPPAMMASHRSVGMFCLPSYRPTLWKHLYLPGAVLVGLIVGMAHAGRRLTAFGLLNGALLFLWLPDMINPDTALVWPPWGEKANLHDPGGEIHLLFPAMILFSVLATQAGLLAGFIWRARLARRLPQG